MCIRDSSEPCAGKKPFGKECSFAGQEHGMFFVMGKEISGKQKRPVRPVFPVIVEKVQIAVDVYKRQDEHYAGGDAGSVASLGYVEKGIKDTLELEMCIRDRCVRRTGYRWSVL